MNRALRQRHRWLWSVLVLVLIAVGLRTWQRAGATRAALDVAPVRDAATVNPTRVSAAPLGDAVP